MTGTDPTAPGLIALAAQLGDDAEHLYSRTVRRKETLRAAAAQVLAITGEARSSDGLVTVTVDVGGMLTDVVLGRAAARTEPARLAQVITATAQQAAARAREAVARVYEPLRDEGLLRDSPLLLPTPSVVAPQPPTVDEDWSDGPGLFRRDSW